MTIVTLKHCLICYKYDGKAGGGSDSSESASLQLHQDGRKKGEICDRFCTLVSRYLPLTYSECGHFPPERTIKTKLSMTLTHVCDRCLPQLEAFCQMYDELQRLQFKMNMKLEEISGLMEQSDKENDAHFVTGRGHLEQKLARVERTMEEIDNFRNAFKKSALKKGSTVFPHVAIPIMSSSDDSSSEDDLFLPVKRKKKGRKVRKVVSPAKSCDIVSVGQTDDEDSDSDKDLFSPVVKKKEKSSKVKDWKPKSESKSKRRSRQDKERKVDSDHSDDNLFITIKKKSKSEKHKVKNRKFHSQAEQSRSLPSARSQPPEYESRKRKPANGKVKYETELKEVVTIDENDEETMSNSVTYGHAVLNMIKASRSRSSLSPKRNVSGSDSDSKKVKMEDETRDKDKKWDMKKTKNDQDRKQDEAIRDKNKKEIVEAWGKVITLS